MSRNSNGAAEWIGILLGVLFIAAFALVMIGVSCAIWAGIFWLAAYFIPGLEVWAQSIGAHFWYFGVVVGLITAVRRK